MGNYLFQARDNETGILYTKHSHSPRGGYLAWREERYKGKPVPGTVVGSVIDVQNGHMVGMLSSGEFYLLKKI